MYINILFDIVYLLFIHFFFFDDKLFQVYNYDLYLIAVGSRLMQITKYMDLTNNFHQKYISPPPMIIFMYCSIIMFTSLNEST